MAEGRLMPTNREQAKQRAMGPYWSSSDDLDEPTAFIRKPTKMHHRVRRVRESPVALPAEQDTRAGTSSDSGKR